MGFIDALFSYYFDNWGWLILLVITTSLFLGVLIDNQRNNNGGIFWLVCLALCVLACATGGVFALGGSELRANLLNYQLSLFYAGVVALIASPLLLLGYWMTRRREVPQIASSFAMPPTTVPDPAYDPAAYGATMDVNTPSPYGATADPQPYNANYDAGGGNYGVGAYVSPDANTQIEDGYGGNPQIPLPTAIQQQPAYPQPQPAYPQPQPAYPQPQPAPYSANLGTGGGGFGGGGAPAPAPIPSPMQGARPPTSKPTLNVWLQDVKTRQRYPLVQGITTIGRDPNFDIYLQDSAVSRGGHATIKQAGRAFLLQVTGPTKVNNQPVRGEIQLSNGDKIWFGNVEMVFMQ
jgi:hypothetical protein